MTATQYNPVVQALVDLCNEQIADDKIVEAKHAFRSAIDVANLLGVEVPAMPKELMANPLADAWQQGFEAGARNESADTNPYYNLYGSTGERKRRNLGD